MNTQITLLLTCALALTACPETDPEGTLPADPNASAADGTSNHNNSSWRCSEDCVLLKGSLTYKGEHEGSPQLDFMEISETTNDPPSRLHAMPLVKGSVKDGVGAVSYTHLTLPTILLV